MLSTETNSSCNNSVIHVCSMIDNDILEDGCNNLKYGPCSTQEFILCFPNILFNSNFPRTVQFSFPKILLLILSTFFSLKYDLHICCGTA